MESKISENSLKKSQDLMNPILILEDEIEKYKKAVDSLQKTNTQPKELHVFFY